MKDMKAGRFGSVMVVSLTVGVLLSHPSPDALGTEFGDISVDTRLRLETAEINGLKDADALTLRLRLGYATPVYHGLQAVVGGEFTGVADEDSYNAANVHGDSEASVIADTKNAQLDEAYLSYACEDTDTLAKVGRQRIVLDNARFVGDVSWRQNRQTFDAVSLRNTRVEDLSVFYGFIDNAVRIFGSDAPASGGNAEEAESSSHLANVSYKVCDHSTVTAYAYLLDLDNVPPILSSDSYGVSAKGPLLKKDNLTLGYYAEYAYQEDAGDNPRDYSADYYHLVLNAATAGFVSDLGYEVLGSDNTGALDEDESPIYASFQTPLATGHKFNGFADRFLVTPAQGLEDFYVMLGYTFELPKAGKLIAKAWYHDFSSESGSADLGDEWDAVLVKPFKLESVPGTFKALAKYADYAAGDVGADTERFSIELNYGATF